MGNISNLKSAQKLAKSGDFSAADAAFESTSGDVRALVQHALALTRQSRQDEAIAKIRQAVSAAPDNPVAAIFYAYILTRFGKLGDAREALKKAATLAPKNPIVVTLDGTLEILSGNLKRGCETLLEKPLTDNLEILGWMLAIVERKIFELAGTDSGVLPPDSPEPPSEVILEGLNATTAAQRGQAALEQGRPAAASKYLSYAVAQKPDDLDLKALLGGALFESRRFGEAEQMLSQVPATHPMGGITQLYRAANAYRLGNFEQALELAKSLPQTGDVVLYSEWVDLIIGLSLVALDRTGEAAELLAKFIDTEPELVARRLKKAAELWEKK